MDEIQRNVADGTDLAGALWAEIAQCLEDQKARLFDQIRSYPTPITACDQQFDCLLEEQAKVAGELARMRRVVSEASHGDSIDAIEAFVRACPCIDAGFSEQLRARLRPEKA